MSAEPARTTTSAKGRTILRPRFTVGTPDLVRIEPGRTLICPARPASASRSLSWPATARTPPSWCWRSPRAWAPRASRKPGPSRASASRSLHPRPRVLRAARVPAAQSDPLDPRRPAPAAAGGPQDEDGRSRAPRARVLPAGPLTGYNPPWRQLAAATAAPARCSLAVTRYGVRSS
jgi:hypothetical protein